MDRKNFLKKAALGVVASAIGTNSWQATKSAENNSTYAKLMEQVGFNHLPNKELKTMKSVLHKASTRGHANHGWLDSYHSFSFANYHNPERMNFGVLRVLNDDTVAGGKGFGRHPHDNMEIISIPLEGDLEHKDSMGNTTVIRAGDVQVMSAGTGVFHSEYNKHKEQPVKFLQIWMFPNKKNVAPRYDQITVDTKSLDNQFHQILSPSAEDEGVWAHQNAWFHLGHFEQGKQLTYKVKATGNGIYAFILSGEVTIDGQALSSRDGYGLWDIEEMSITANSDAKVLLMDVPMQLS